MSAQSDKTLLDSGHVGHRVQHDSRNAFCKPSCTVIKSTQYCQLNRSMTILTLITCQFDDTLSTVIKIHSTISSTVESCHFLVYEEKISR